MDGQLHDSISLVYSYRYFLSDKVRWTQYAELIQSVFSACTSFVVLWLRNWRLPGYLLPVVSNSAFLYVSDSDAMGVRRVPGPVQLLMPHRVRVSHFLRPWSTSFVSAVAQFVSWMCQTDCSIVIVVIYDLWPSWTASHIHKPAFCIAGVCA
jgi:hypothetical protein